MMMMKCDIRMMLIGLFDDMQMFDLSVSLFLDQCSIYVTFMCSVCCF